MTNLPIKDVTPKETNDMPTQNREHAGNFSPVVARKGTEQWMWWYSRENAERYGCTEIQEPTAAELKTIKAIHNADMAGRMPSDAAGRKITALLEARDRQTRITEAQQ